MPRRILDGEIYVPGQWPDRDCGIVGSRPAPFVPAPKLARAARSKIRLRTRPMRRVHGADRRKGCSFVCDTCKAGGESCHHHHRGARHAGEAGPCAGGLHRRSGRAVRLLHKRNDYDCQILAQPNGTAGPRASEAGPCHQPLPVRHSHPYHQRDYARITAREEATMSAIPSHFLSRRDLLKSGGSLVVSFAFGAARVGHSLAQQLPSPQSPGKPLDPHQVDSFIAVHADGSVTLYTGKVDVGTGLRIAVRQMAAEELGVPVNRVSLVEGDTYLTPDQGGTGGSTGLPRGGTELRRAAATARQAILKLGSERLKRPAEELMIAAGQVRPKAGGPGVGIGTLIGGKLLDV